MTAFTWEGAASWETYCCGEVTDFVTDLNPSSAIPEKDKSTFFDFYSAEKLNVFGSLKFIIPHSENLVIVCWSAGRDIMWLRLTHICCDLPGSPWIVSMIKEFSCAVFENKVYLCVCVCVSHTIVCNALWPNLIIPKTLVLNRKWYCVCYRTEISL